MVEHESHGTAGLQGAAALGEVAADIGHGTGVVVRGGLYQIGDAEGAETFIDNLFEVAGLGLGGLLDGTFDVFLGHLLTLGLCDEGAETGVAGHFRTALLDGDGDFLAQFGKGFGHVAPTLHFAFLAEFKSSSHNYSAISMREIYLSISMASGALPHLSLISL